uniref:Uncharacterized protein n=1 Tax=Mycena chlorophos TaxID=658473 RepID=A0ABQ0MD50_MYCCL|nr:predicted protein [Mycena chlorophos]
MTRLSTMFESKDAQRARVEAEIAARSEMFRARPTLKIGARTVINPLFEGDNPFEDPELLDPENEGVLREPMEEIVERRKERPKSEVIHRTPWLRNEHGHRNPRYSAPAVLEALPNYNDDEDPFRKDEMPGTSGSANSFFLDEEEETKRARRRTITFEPVDFLHVEIPHAQLDLGIVAD